MRPKTTVVALGLLALAGCGQADDGATVPTSPRVVAAGEIEAGRYLVRVGGCNDCHTSGYIASGGKTPEAEWLRGNNHGFFGPWGTTYAHNLRLTTANLTEDAWVEMLSTRDALPIMPWPSSTPCTRRTSARSIATSAACPAAPARRRRRPCRPGRRLRRPMKT